MPTSIVLTLRAGALIALAAVMLGACSKEAESSHPTPDGEASSTPAAPEGPRQDFDPRTTADVNEKVYREYASLALGIPRREQDSIVKSTPISELEAAMTARLRRQDSVARAQLSEKYSIPLDSVDAILAARNVPQR